MSVRMFRHQLTEKVILGGADELIGWAQIPKDSVLNNVWGECHVIAQAQVGIEFASMYGVKGLVLPEIDPDDAHNAYDSWNTYVSPDVDFSAGGLDQDIGDAVYSGSYFEPGEGNINALMDMELYGDDAEWFNRVKLLTYASHKSGFDASTVPGDYVPTDFFKIRARKNRHADMHSWVLLGMGVPAMDDTTATVETFQDPKWFQLQYVEMVLEQAFTHLAGLVEAGAETPYEDASQMLEDWLEPTVYEQSSGAFVSTNFRTYTSLTFDVTVPGSPNVSTISAR